jgi:MazG family protein
MLSEQKGQTYPRLVELMQRLLAPDGCPWDREQNLKTLRRYIVEEACEVVDAIDRDDMAELREELGDLLLQVVFVSELARDRGAFGPDDVVAAIVEKLVRRHPHVFGDVELSDADEVLDNWERIKAEERAGDAAKSVLSTVPRGLPALSRAQRVSEKVARVGFDWPDEQGPKAKIAEELQELEQAMAGEDSQAIEEEFGDLLFAMVNLARHRKIDAEAALRGATRKFVDRFAHVERCVDEEHGGFAKGKLPLEVLDRYWDEAKTAEPADGV